MATEKTHENRRRMTRIDERSERVSENERDTETQREMRKSGRSQKKRKDMFDGARLFTHIEGEREREMEKMTKCTH